MERKDIQAFKHAASTEVTFNNMLFNKERIYDLVMEESDGTVKFYQPNDTTAHCFHNIIRLADAFHLNYYFGVMELDTGKHIPTLNCF